MDGLTANQAVEQGEGGSNSIFGIANHLLFWNERYLKLFNQDTLPSHEISNADTFRVDSLDEDPEAWEDLKMKLDNLFTRWEQVVTQCDESKLDERTHPDSEEAWWMSLAHIVIHNAYHIGQIVHIRKEQGLWKSLKCLM